MSSQKDLATFFEEWREKSKDTDQRLIEAEHRIIEPLRHLEHLKDISNSLQKIEVGLLSQNSALLNQNQVLFRPAASFYRTFTSIVSFIILLLGIATFILLLRESGKDLHISKQGFSLKGSQH